VSSNPTTSTGRSGARIQLGSRRGRAALVGAALLVALPVLAGCAAGNNPQVYQIQPNNGHAKAGYMWISNVWVVADTTTGNAEVIGQVANTDPTATNSVELTSVTVAGATATIVPPADTAKLGAGVQVASGSVTIPGLGSVQFGQNGQPELELANADLTVGANTQVVYTFSNGQTATVTAIVQPPTGLWAGYNPNGANGTPTATASGTATTTGTATATASGTSTATAGATGTSTATATGTAKASGTATATATASASATR
jgi:hypothetical protein